MMLLTCACDAPDTQSDVDKLVGAQSPILFPHYLYSENLQKYYEYHVCFSATGPDGE